MLAPRAVGGAVASMHRAAEKAHSRKLVFVRPHTYTVPGRRQAGLFTGLPREEFFLEEFFSKTHLLESSLAAPCVADLRAPWSRRCWTIGRALPHLDIDAEGTTIRRRENLQGRRVGPWWVVVGFGMGGGRDSEGSSGRGMSEIPLSLHGSRAR